MDARAWSRFRGGVRLRSPLPHGTRCAPHRKTDPTSVANLELARKQRVLSEKKKADVFYKLIHGDGYTG